MDHSFHGAVRIHWAPGAMDTVCLLACHERARRPSAGARFASRWSVAVASRQSLAAIAQHNDEVELVGVCDTSGSALSAAVEGKGRPSRLDSLRRLALPTARPLPQRMRGRAPSARAGVHVVTEKPMPRAGRRLDMVPTGGVRLFVVKQNRQRRCSCLRAMVQRRSGVCSWRSTCSGRVRRVTTTALPGAAPGSSTVAHS